ncbi:hypothetical protein BD289DRAFT_451804 [Coniella lustricola]|uniref:Glycosyltransferase family 25 protein n=1 Tax=Coniella lustricola TaxID=2025994 RepID=A0A2T3ADC9_9PEZI|nr:hypothetical protein BD289DRAFT_451804 [Coniella lustricola]
MLLARPRLVVAATGALLVFCSFYLLRPHQQLPRFSFSVGGPPSSSIKTTNKPYGRDYKGHAEPADINRVANGTLGFGKVFIVGLPERTDKRDAMALASSLTGFDIDWVDGVRGETIPNKAVPFGTNRKKLRETNLGSWRGHMNAIKRVLEESLDSALIMEDDMDWDVRLKPQLELTAAGPFPENLEENLDASVDDDTDYGLQAMARKFTILGDATVPSHAHLTGIVDFAQHPEHTRWVHVTAAPICTFAYAVSRRGAHKILYDLSVDRLVGPFDNALAWLCRRAVGSWRGLGRGEDPDSLGDRGLDAKCLSVTPPLFFHHKAKGLVNADSDIHNYGGGDGGDDSEEGASEKPPPEMREKGTTENIVWSARLNIANMIADREMESQW